MTLFSDSSGEAPADGFEKAPRPKRIRAIIGYCLTALFFVGAGYALYAPTPYVIEQPGTSFNVLGSVEGAKVIDISGTKTYDDSGKLFLLTVGLVGSPDKTPSWLEVLQAWNDPHKNVIPLDAVYPPGQDATAATKEELAMMQDSQQQAGAAALRELGIKVANKVKVVAVAKGTPADGLLKAGDFIAAVDGINLPNGDTLRSTVKQHANKSALKLTVQRAGKEQSVSIVPTQINGVWRMGVTIVDTYVLPFKVDLTLQNVGGPSGGMMFALGIIDKLTPGSLTGGQAVAGTGTIDGNGNVGPIGGIQQKMWGAQSAGATWFLTPDTNCDEVVGHIPEGLHVTKVATLKDALKALKAIAANPETTALPQCSASK